MSKLIDFWKSLPHQVQAVIMFFGGSVLGTLAKYALTPGACLSFYCWREYIGQSFSTGLVAVLGLYTKSSFYEGVTK
jgi:hypothetical protein